MKLKQKRWMASALATSRTDLPALPFSRGNRATRPPLRRRLAIRDLRQA